MSDDIILRIGYGLPLVGKYAIIVPFPQNESKTLKRPLVYPQ
jgi:hypothetical protein